MNVVELGLIPTVAFDKMMAAIVVVNNRPAYLEIQLVCRTAQPQSIAASGIQMDRHADAQV